MSTADYTDQVHVDISEPEQTGAHDALQLLVLGGVCGLMFHWLVWGQSGGGLGLLLWTGLSCATALWLNRQQSTGWRRELLCWCAVIMVAALMTVWRDALAVRALMYVVMLLCLGLIFFRAAGNSLLSATIPLALRAVLRFPPRVLLGFFPAVDAVLNARWKNSGRVAGVFRGLLLAAPLLLVFVMLFASADAVFSLQLERLGQAVDGLAPQTPLISLMLSVIATGVLSCSLLQRPVPPQTASAQPQGLWPGFGIRLGAEETAVILGSLVLLFITFVILQASYLFGGREVLEARSGLTLAAYARRGFFELLAVAALTLGVLVALSVAQCHQRLFRLLGGALIVCVLIILVSALYRLSLYIEQFGLTMARLMALALMLWLAGALIWFGATVLRGNVRGFMAGLVYAMLAGSLLLALGNPAARVAQVNLLHARTSGIPVDIDYLVRLGADSVPVIIRHLEPAGLSQPDQNQSSQNQSGRSQSGLTQNEAASTVMCRATERWFARWQVADADWRNWNAARATAVRDVSGLQRGCQAVSI